MTEIHLIQSCITDKTWPVIPDTGVVVSRVRTSGCLNEQLSISWRINQVQQRGGGFPACRGHLGYYPLQCKILLSCCTRKSPRQKFNLKSDAVLLQTAGLTVPTFITDTVNMAADQAPAMRLYYIRYIDLHMSLWSRWRPAEIPAASSYRRHTLHRYTTQTRQVSAPGRYTVEGRKRIYALCFKDKSEPLSDDSYAIILFCSTFFSVYFEKSRTCVRLILNRWTRENNSTHMGRRTSWG